MLDELVAMLEERALDHAGQLDGAAAWLDRVKPLTAGHFVRWFPQSYRDAMALVDEVRARHGLELDRRPKLAPSFPRTARDARLRDPEPASKVPEILGERAARERARREHERAFRRVDAQALLDVHREATSRGEVTRVRFNTAYRRLHPTFDCAERRRRALVLTYRGYGIEAKVRGPHGVEFSAIRPAGTDERALIAALLYRIEMAAGVGARQRRPRAVDPTRKSTKATHNPSADVDAPAQEPGVHTAATTGPTEPEAVAALMREIEQLTSMLFERPNHEATDATPGSEDQTNANAVDEGRPAGEPVAAKERTVEDTSAEPAPQDDPLEQENAALVAEPGTSTSAPLLTDASGDAPPSTTQHRAPPSTTQHRAPPAIERQPRRVQARRPRSHPLPPSSAPTTPRNRGPPLPARH